MRLPTTTPNSGLAKVPQGLEEAKGASRFTTVTRSWHPLAPQRMALCAVLGALLALAPPALAAQPGSSASDLAASSAKAPEIPLPELPKLQPITLEPPAASVTESLESRLDQLSHTEAADPLAPVDLGFLTADLNAEMVSAIARRRQALGKELNGSAASRLLDKARSAGRKAIRKQRKANKKKKVKGDEPVSDWLVFILALPKRDSQDWRDLVELYGMLRMLEHLGSTPAVREMIAHYSTFGELVRIDLQRAIGRLGHHAVAALIEAKKHEARKVRRWAQRQLDGMGRAIPGEAVSTSDPVILADVLRAFGRVRDLDATRIILSFANSDRVQLRRAARESIAAMGEPAAFHLRDAYKNLSGAKPPRSWDYRRTARELFRLHDRARLTAVYTLLRTGSNALAKGHYEEATKAFDQVLARAPLIEGRSEMAPAYLGQADSLIAKAQRPEALAALRKALRLAPDGPERPKIESRLALLEGQALVEKGTPDRFILRRAIELDPENVEAKKLLASLVEAADARQTKSKRSLAAIVVGVIGLAAIVLLAFWRRPQTKRGLAKESGKATGADDTPLPRTGEQDEPSPGPDGVGSA